MFRYHLVRIWMYITSFLLLAHVHTEGRENIPDSGPFIVTVNHMSTADTPILLIAFPVRPWRFFAGEKWKNHPIIGPIMGWLGAIYINRGEADRKALKEAMDALKKGAIFGLAPEGTRSKNGQLNHARDGAAYLASRANVPILPVGIANSDKLFANFKRLRPTRIEVHIGQPYALPALGRRAKGDDLAAYTHLIMVKIAALLPERYAGVYADSPALAALRAGEDPWPYCQKAVSGEPITDNR
ncbi:MAG: lysophospholipid acyltransferase family protein [Candidatus Promineifilaceae bacterium]